MVLETIFNNLTNYVFGSTVLLGIFLVFMVVKACIVSKISQIALITLLSPLLVALAHYGFLNPVFKVVVYIGVLMLWGLMFKSMLGK